MGELHSINLLRAADVKLESTSVVGEPQRRPQTACKYIATSILVVGAEEKGGIS